jgi:hypothetical protein
MCSVKPKLSPHRSRANTLDQHQPQAAQTIPRVSRTGASQGHLVGEAYAGRAPKGRRYGGRLSTKFPCGWRPPLERPTIHIATKSSVDAVNRGINRGII